MSKMVLLATLFVSALLSFCQAEVRYTVTDLGTTGTGYAYGINDSRQVVGISSGHAFIWTGGILTDLGITGEIASAAYGINNNGQVVGKSETLETHNGSVVNVKTAILWEGGTYTELAPVPCKN